MYLDSADRALLAFWVLNRFNKAPVINPPLGFESCPAHQSNFYFIRSNVHVLLRWFPPHTLPDNNW